MDKSTVIFGNKIDKKTIKEAVKSKSKYIKKYGDDSAVNYELTAETIPSLSFMNTSNLILKESQTSNIDSTTVKIDSQTFNTDSQTIKQPLIVGNIRMGFGHYRISMAIASCANALGYKPYWLDFASLKTTGSKMIREQNQLYSLASRISQKSKLFNHFVWEPLNSEGFKKLTYNAKDQKNSELLAPILKNIPKETPFIATHVWPSQAAVHAGMFNVVNAIPDNWPMGLHLSEGAIHAVQTPFAYLGYKTLQGFAKKPLKGIPENQIFMTGHYVDHELLVNLEENNRRRIERATSGKPLRFLLTVGGAGAGFDLFLSTVEHLLPYVQAKKAVIFINFGDHREVYEKLCKKIKLNDVKTFFNEYEKLQNFATSLSKEEPSGIYAIYNQNIFEAVYSTNLLMPETDFLITKPSELAYYPVPKIFMKHIGGHEVYGAVNSQELGDGTRECPTSKSMNEMLDRVIGDREILVHLSKRINELKSQGYYDGGYNCVKLATGQNAKNLHSIE